ncbi:MAG: benzoate/H(+) symporter BenE family transporter [Beijerinckiaceae bacterium]
MLQIEQTSPHKPTFSEIIRDIGPTQLATGFVAFLFGATGPLAIILSVGTAGGLSPSQIASFVFGVFTINGLITILLTWAYRQPLAMFWTIPGTVLMGPALGHMSFAEVVGAFYATGLVVLMLGWTGLARRMLEAIPLPIVMAMVAGIFLKFGVDIVRSMHSDIAIAGAMVATFFGLSAAPRAAKFMPPLIGALIVGLVISVTGGKFAAGAISGLQFAQPEFTAPVFSLRAMMELVVPLVITVVIVQHGQGFAVLTNAGHAPPLTAVNVAAGFGGILSATVGAVCTSLTGPTNGLITSAGPRERHYATAIVTAVLAAIFGLLAPTFTRLMLAAPKELILTLGGLAMLRVLLGGFMAAFKGPFALGALTCFVVTVADMPILNVGAAFWGLVAGVLVSFLAERADFKQR